MLAPKGKSLLKALSVAKGSVHMKNFSKIRRLGLQGLALALLCGAAAHAQTRDARFISASAGGVNFVAGDVKVRRAGQADWHGVSVKEDLRSGDVARTGADGRVEVLLNPGSYMRAGGSTEFELADASLDSLRLRLARGGAVIEATGYGDSDLDIHVVTPSASVHIVRTGVYRIDVSPAGETVVAVQKGRALLGDGAAALLLKGGKVARVARVGGAEVAKIDKGQRDSLDEWSRERGRELTKINDGLANRQTNAMLASFHFTDFWKAEYPGGLGLWVWSGSRSCYTFLPFYTGFRSPYGFGYSSFFMPPYGYYGYNNCYGCRLGNGPIILRGTTPAGAPTPPPTIVNNGGGSGTPSAGGGGGNSGGGFGGGGTTGGGGGFGGGGRTPGPSPLPPPSAPSIDRPMRERSIEPGSRPTNQ
jgi:uncharacterized membrane protein YgcG